MAGCNVALAPIRYFPSFGRIDRALGAAGPKSTLEDLDDLGLGRWRPSVLAAIFHDAFRRGDLRKAMAAQNALWNHPKGIESTRRRDIPLMPWRRMAETAQGVEGYLFVSGVPRSGTTALGRLLGGHRDVGMFTELYASAYGYTPEMFEPKNVALLAERGLLRFGKLNRAALEKLARCKFVGDKRPNFMQSAELTLANFATKSVTVVHIVRSIYDVASSYQKKFEDDSWVRNYRDAVQDANINNRNALKLAHGARRDCLVVLDYDRFWQSANHAYALFEHLGLDNNGMHTARLDLFLEIARRIRKRQRELTPRRKAFIVDNYDMNAENELRSRSHAGF